MLKNCWKCFYTKACISIVTAVAIVIRTVRIAIRRNTAISIIRKNIIATAFSLAFWQFMIFIEKPYREGTVVNGRYTIQTQLGEGSYGVAYVARDEETKELVVLKQMKRTKRKKRRASFEREALILKSSIILKYRSCTTRLTCAARCILSWNILKEIRLRRLFLIKTKRTMKKKRFHYWQMCCVSCNTFTRTALSIAIYASQISFS